MPDYQICKEGGMPHPRTSYCDAGINHSAPIERLIGNPNENADWCDDCHGYTHMPYCPAYTEPTSNKHKGDVMFDEVEEDEREIRRLQRGELFRRPKPKLPEQQGDVMERRDRTAANDFSRLLDKVMYADSTQARIDARLQAAREYTTLVEQRDLLVSALRRVRVAYNQGPSAEKVRVAMDAAIDYVDNALATVEQGEGRE